MKTPRQNFDVCITLKFKRKLKYIDRGSVSQTFLSVYEQQFEQGIVDHLKLRWRSKKSQHY